MQQSAYYRPSGKFTAGAFLLCLALGLVAAIILSPLYAWAIRSISFIYINFFICLGLGMGVGLAVSSGAQKAHLRSPSVAVIIGLLCGLVAVYLQWVFFLAVLVMEVQPDAGIVELVMMLLVSPAEVFSEVMDISEYGLWSFKGDTIKGDMLLGVWVAEVVVIVVGAISMARNASEKPYSETCKAWMTKEDLTCPLDMPADAKALVSSIEQGSLAQLLALPFPEDPYHGLRLAVYSCEGDANAYLSITGVKPKKKVKEGKKPELSEDNIAKFLKISSTQLQELKAYLQSLEQAHPEAVPA